jgi:hypothetical protein
MNSEVGSCRGRLITGGGSRKFHSNILMVGTDQLTDERWGPKIRFLTAYEEPYTEAYARFI